jgi:hypothetical protein
MMTDEAAKIDPKNLEIRLTRFETFRPKEGYGTIATFDVVIVDLIEIKNFKIRKVPDRRFILSTARLERNGGFSVELRNWLNRKIRKMAMERLRDIARNDLAFLEEADVDEVEDLPPYVPGLDVAALPAQLMRAVRVARGAVRGQDG